MNLYISFAGDHSAYHLLRSRQGAPNRNETVPYTEDRSMTEASLFRAIAESVADTSENQRLKAIINPNLIVPENQEILEPLFRTLNTFAQINRYVLVDLTTGSEPTDILRHIDAENDVFRVLIGHMASHRLRLALPLFITCLQQLETLFANSIQQQLISELQLQVSGEFNRSFVQQDENDGTNYVRQLDSLPNLTRLIFTTVDESFDAVLDAVTLNIETVYRLRNLCVRNFTQIDDFFIDTDLPICDLQYDQEESDNVKMAAQWKLHRDGYGHLRPGFWAVFNDKQIKKKGTS